MISLNNVSSAGSASQYFSADNYYTEKQGLENSEWFGAGAKTLGLEGKVDKEAFLAVLGGSVEGQELGKFKVDENTGEAVRDHRPGIDVTFSAPKSVSILAEVYGDLEVREAHEAAVKKALSYIESELAVTRQTVNGETETVKTGNIVVAMFRHNTSRDLDPQTHTHALLMNATKREDGQWRSLTNDEIYKSQRVLGAIYNSELAKELQDRGFDLRRTDDKGNFEIAQISRDQVEHYSQRRTAIAESLAKKGIDINDATAQEKEDATLKTRSRKEEVNGPALIRNWQGRAEELGINFAKIKGEAVKAQEAGGIDREDKITGHAAISFAAAHLIEREAVVSKDQLFYTAIEHGAGRVSVQEIQQAFSKLEKNGDLVRLPDGDYTTKKMLASEVWAVEKVLSEKAKTSPIMNVGDVQGKITSSEDRQGFKFTEGQKESLQMVLTSPDRYVAADGLAGTGKTTMLNALRSIANDEDYTVRAMAPTGAASKVLARETGISTDTVDMFLIKERRFQKDLEEAKVYLPGFERKAELWIVDESSFLSQRKMAQLHSMAEKANAKVVYLGDKMQLQGVEAGKPFELAQKAGIETSHMTEISRQKTDEMKMAIDIMTGRDQLQPGERLTNVQLRNNARTFEYMDKAGMVHEIKEDVVGQLVKDYAGMGAEERARTIVITPYNEDRQAINTGVRELLKDKGELGTIEHDRSVLVSKGWTRAVQNEAQYYKEGDVVRFGRSYQKVDAQKGDYAKVVAVSAKEGVVILGKDDGSNIRWEPGKYNKVEVFDTDRRLLSDGDLIRFTRNSGEFKNGEIAKVLSVNGSDAVLQLRQGENVSEHRVNLDSNKHWDHAYASTVHASQGATQYRAMFHIRTPEPGSERKQDRDLEKMAKVFGDRSFYVGATRVSHELHIYTDNKAMAAKAVTGHQDKTSALEAVQKTGQER